MELTRHDPDPDEPEVYRPIGGDVDIHAEAIMQQGKATAFHDNDLRDPWFHTPEGHDWLRDLGER